MPEPERPEPLRLDPTQIIMLARSVALLDVHLATGHEEIHGAFGMALMRMHRDDPDSLPYQVGGIWQHLSQVITTTQEPRPTDGRTGAPCFSTIGGFVHAEDAVLVQNRIGEMYLALGYEDVPYFDPMDPTVLYKALPTVDPLIERPTEGGAVHADENGLHVEGQPNPAWLDMVGRVYDEMHTEDRHCPAPPLGCGQTYSTDSFRDAEARRENLMSGLCQSCQDATWSESVSS
jgi:hypothetical protein